MWKKNSKYQSLTQEHISQIYAISTNESQLSFRQKKALIKDPTGKVLDRQFPEAEYVSELMAEFFKWYEYSEKNAVLAHPLVKGLAANAVLISIHPFGDGNGRVSRLVEHWIASRDMPEFSRWIHPELMVHLYYRQYIEMLLTARQEMQLDSYILFFLSRYSEFLKRVPLHAS